MACPFLIEILQGFVALEEIPNVARYLDAGRQRACLEDSALQRAWLNGWAVYNNYPRHRASQWTYCMDLDAEHTLRGLDRLEDEIPMWFVERLADRNFLNAPQPALYVWVKRQIKHRLRQCSGRGIDGRKP
jgi:hypothetical protein